MTARKPGAVTKTHNVRIPIEVYEVIAEYARTKDRSVSWVMNTIITTAAKRMPVEVTAKG